MAYCPHCLAPNAAGQSCLSCGQDLTWSGEESLDLPVGTVLSNGDGRRQYWIGAALDRDGFGTTYNAIETNSQRRVSIQEYFPAKYARRAEDGMQLEPISGQEQFFRDGLISFFSVGRALTRQGEPNNAVRILDGFLANNTAYIVLEDLDGQQRQGALHWDTRPERQIDGRSTLHRHG